MRISALLPVMLTICPALSQNNASPNAQVTTVRVDTSHVINSFDLNSSSQAGFSIITLTPGSHTILACYSGDSNVVPV